MVPPNPTPLHPTLPLCVQSPMDTGIQGMKGHE